MTCATPGIGRWKAFWPLVLVALAVRVGFGSFAPPAVAPGGPVARLAAFSVLCDGQKHDDGTPHPPADAGEGVLLLVLGDTLSAAALGTEAIVAPLILFTVIAPNWCFPPVRGPPARSTSALYAQGPPA